MLHDIVDRYWGNLLFMAYLQVVLARVIGNGICWNSMTMQYHMWRAIVSYNFLRGAGDLVRALTCDAHQEAHTSHNVPNMMSYLLHVWISRSPMICVLGNTTWTSNIWHSIGFDSPLGKKTLQGSMLMTSNHNCVAHFDNIRPCLVTIVTQTFISMFCLVYVM